MNHDERNEISGPTRNFRNTLDVGMGFFYIAIAIAVLTMKYFGTMMLTSVQAYILGGMVLIYGSYRMYRGISALRKMRQPRRRQL